MPTLIDAESLRIRILTLLESDRPARERLVSLVHLLDAQVEARLRQGIYAGAAIGLVSRCLALATVAAGDLLRPAAGERFARNVEATVEAARAYVANPAEEAWDRLCAAATQSYPFGPGDGCHALDELGGHGAFGSGCCSGAGFIDAIARGVGDDEAVMAALRGIIVPGLRISKVPPLGS